MWHLKKLNEISAACCIKQKFVSCRWTASGWRITYISSHTLFNTTLVTKLFGLKWTFYGILCGIRVTYKIFCISTKRFCRYPKHKKICSVRYYPPVTKGLMLELVWGMFYNKQRSKSITVYTPLYFTTHWGDRQSLFMFLFVYISLWMQYLFKKIS